MSQGLRAGTKSAVSPRSLDPRVEINPLGLYIDLYDLGLPPKSLLEAPLSL